MGRGQDSSIRRDRPPFLRPPIALAHRGGAAEGSENSPVTFERAVGLGFRHIETDVQASRDAQAVIFHDPTVDRTTNKSGPVSELSMTEISNLQLSDGASPITLSEALRAWPKTTFNVDVKSEAAIKPFLAAVTENQAWDRICAASFSTARLRRLRSLAGHRLATSMGSSEVAALVAALPWKSAACAVQVPASQGPLPIVTSAFVRRAHNRGLQVHVWTVDEEAEMNRLLDLGVDGIVTDRPSLLRAVLIERGDWR